LEEGHSVIVDATHPTQERREQLAKIARSSGARVRCIHKNVDVNTAISRSKLAPDIRPIVVRQFFKRFEKPTTTECDAIHTVSNVAQTNKNEIQTEEKKNINEVEYAPQPMLAEKYDPNYHVGPYYVSEKLDGIRALAYKGQLYTRSGNPIAAPQWFLDQIPKGTFDGELYTGRKSFNRTSSTVMKKTPVDAEWKKVQYRIFDDHASKNSYGKTLNALKKKLPPCSDTTPQICLVDQTLVDNQNVINRMRNEVEQQGGEGLMLRSDSKYAPGQRSEKILKVKSHKEREARVIGINKKPDGSIKSFQMKFVGQPYEGVEFNLAVQSEAKKAQIRIGHLLTIKFFEYTKTGKPRFPTFKGIRKNISV
jgi:DNA ligase-1